MTFLNFLKGSIGPGCLSLPLAMKEAGLWMGIFLIMFYGFLNNYSMLQLVHCSQHLSKKKGNANFNYGSVALEACSNSFRWIKPYRNIMRCHYSCIILIKSNL